MLDTVLRPRRLQALVILFMAGVGLTATMTAFSAQPVSGLNSPNGSCQTGADCFQFALSSSKKTSNGQTAIPNDAVSIFERIQSHYPDTDWSKRAGIHLGLLLTESDPEAAFQYFQTGLQDFPVLEDYLRFWMGEAQLHADHPHEAAQLFESVTAQFPDSVLHTDALFEGGHAWYEVGECDRAVHLFREALQERPRSDLAPKSLLRLGKCEYNVGRPKKAREVFRELWWRFPTKPESKTAQEFLQQYRLDDDGGPTADERFQRAVAFYKEAAFGQAVSELRRFLREVPSGPQHDKAQYKLGNALARQKRYGRAEKVFEKLSTSRSDQAGAATVWLARAYLRQDKGPQLLRVQEQAASRGASRNQQALIHVFSGIWLEDHGQYDQAISSFHQAAKIGQSPKRRLDALWRIGWRYYQLGDYSRAVTFFEDMHDVKEIGEEHARASYWMGRAMEHLAQRSQAQKRYQELADRLPYTYYGQLASSRLMQPSPPLDSATNGARRVASLPEDNPSLLQDAHYQRAFELVGLNLYQEAAEELRALKRSFAKDPGALRHLLSMAQKAHAYHVGIRLAVVHYGGKLKQGKIPTSSPIWTWAYPNGYVPTIQSYASPRLDPYLVAGLIREESLYNPYAVSYVGALGLMQLMPTTADVVAHRLGLASPHREELFDADVNIHIGTSYVNELLERFKGNLVHTVAAYNAGPAAVTRWIVRNGQKQADEFVESISYRETRGYVKRVLGSYRVYRTLAIGSCQASSLDRMC